MNASRTRLSLAGTFLAEVPSTSVEWSLQVSGTRAVVRDRVIFWTGGRAGENAIAFEKTGAFLDALGASASMLDLQRSLAPWSLRQGIGIIAGDSGDDETCLYIHHVDPATGREHCDAWKWRGAEDPAYAFYEFHFLPHTPEGTAPVDLVHRDLQPLWRALESEPRVRALSGFWLRRRGAHIDQISLTYPWQPAVGEIAELRDVEALRPWLGHHLRHVAMNGTAAPAPSMTLYFSGALQGDAWPETFDELRARAERSAGAASAAMRSRVLDRLTAEDAPKAMPFPPGTPESEPALLASLAPELSASIAEGSSVYVIGSGWGAIPVYLAQTLRCRVVALTDDRAQYLHCAGRGIRARHGTASETLPPGLFDTILVMDGTPGNRLRLFTRRLLVRAPDDTLTRH